MISKMKLVIILTVCISIAFMGCGASNTVKGGAIGAGAGAVIGGLIGKAAGNTAAGAIIGAAVGGTAGALIGRNMDKQAEEMRQDIQGAKIERIGEGIKITFESGILFKSNAADLQPAAQDNIGKLAVILNKYPDTNILVEGHTDSTGSDELNQKLSTRRAESVADYAKGKGVAASRFTTIGYGKTQPIAPNATVDGRAQNRRVEIAIFANDKLKDAAESGQLKE
jgi:outer membrane protein OmpA-like peptidoglycan-associated protein